MNIARHPSPTLTRISASVGPKVLANADSFFVNNRATILAECLQNARRAHASRVSFTMSPTLDGVDLTIADNGDGLARENASVLLSFANSAMEDEDMEAREHAAGIGFFSLARHDVEVSSRSWLMSIPRAAFVGKDHATLSDGHPEMKGLSVTIRGFEGPLDAFAKANPAHHYQKLADDIIAAMRYTGMTAVLEGFGSRDGTYEPEVFLEIPVAEPTNDIRETRHGVTMRLVRAPQSRYDDHHARINFFGQVITAKALSAMTPTETVAHLEIDGVRKCIREQTFGARIFVDVHDTSTLKLRLPDRNAVIEDAGLETLKKMARELYIRALAGEGYIENAPWGRANGIPLTYGLREDAKALGLANKIPAPSIAIDAPHSYRYEGGYETQNAWLMQPSGLVNLDGVQVAPASLISVCPDQFLLSLLEMTEGLNFATDISLTKALPARDYSVLTGLKVHFRSGDQQVAVDLVLPDPTDPDMPAELNSADLDDTVTEAIGDLANTAVDEIQLELLLQRPDETLESRFFPIPCFYWGDQCDPYLVVVKDAIRQNVVSSMLDGLFSTYDDGDTVDTQEEERDAQFTTLVNVILGVTPDYMLEQMNEALRAIFGDYGETFWKNNPTQAFRVEKIDHYPGYRLIA